MPRFKVRATYAWDDEMEVDAQDEQEAMAIADAALRRRVMVISNHHVNLFDIDATKIN